MASRSFKVEGRLSRVAAAVVVIAASFIASSIDAPRSDAQAPRAPQSPASSPKISFPNAANAGASAQNADGRLELVWIWGANVLHRWQLWAGGPWSPIEALGHAPAGASDPVLALDGAQRLEAFVDTPEGTWNIWQVAPNGGWSDWTLTALGLHRAAVIRLIGGTLCSLGRCRMVPGPLKMYGQAANGGDLLETQQFGPGTSWNGVSTSDANPSPGASYEIAAGVDGIHGTPVAIYAAPAWTAFVKPGSNPLIPIGNPPGGFASGSLGAAQNDDGRLEVFAVGADNAVYHDYQVPNADGTWAGWQALPGSSGASGAVLAERNADGRLEILVQNQNGLVHQWQLAPNAGWGAPEALDGAQFGGVLALGQNADGRLEAFVQHPRVAVIDHAWQRSPAIGPWTAVLALEPI